jgi:hypothetical protein
MHRGELFSRNIAEPRDAVVRRTVREKHKGLVPEQRDEAFSPNEPNDVLFHQALQQRHTLRHEIALWHCTVRRQFVNHLGQDARELGCNVVL